MLKICYVQITVIKIINILLQFCEAEHVHTLLYVAEVVIQQHICDNLLSLVHNFTVLGFIIVLSSGVFDSYTSKSSSNYSSSLLSSILLVTSHSLGVSQHFQLSFSYFYGFNNSLDNSANRAQQWSRTTVPRLSRPRLLQYQRMLIPFSSTVITSINIASVGSSFVTVIFSLPSCLVSVTVFIFVSL